MSKGSEKMDAPPMRINFKRVLEEIETFKYNDKTTQQEAAAHTSLLKEKTKRRVIVQVRGSDDDLVGFTASDWNYSSLVTKLQNMHNKAVHFINLNNTKITVDNFHLVQDLDTIQVNWKPGK